MNPSEKLELKVLRLQLRSGRSLSRLELDQLDHLERVEAAVARSGPALPEAAPDPFADRRWGPERRAVAHALLALGPDAAADDVRGWLEKNGAEVDCSTGEYRIRVNGRSWQSWRNMKIGPLRKAVRAHLDRSAPPAAS